MESKTDSRMHPIISECRKLEQKDYKTRNDWSDPLGIVQEV